MKWKDKLIKNIIITLGKNNTTSNLTQLIIDNKINIHLAVFSEPYLSLILSGIKTIESRFSINKVIPYRRIFPNDIVLIKKSGSDIIGLFTVQDTIFFDHLTESKIEKINSVYGRELSWSIDPTFLSTKNDSNFLTLIKIDNVVKLNPITTDKADRTGWSIVKLGYNNTLFENI